MSAKGGGARAYALGEADYAEVPELDDAWFAPHQDGRLRGRPKPAGPARRSS